MELRRPQKKEDNLADLGLSTDSKLYQFKSILHDLPPELQESERYSLFTLKNRHKFSKEITQNEEGDSYKYIDLFTSADQIKIALSLLNQVQITQAEKDENGIKMKGLNIIKNFFYYEGLIVDIIPLHSQVPMTKGSDMNQLRNYYGDTVAQYFYFLQYMQKWLWRAAFMGCLALLLNWWSEEDTDHSPWDSIYSFAMIIWANLFCSYWTRHEKKLQILWRCGAKQIDKNIMLQCKKNDMVVFYDPISGKKKEEFSSKKRLYRYLESLLITVPLVLMSFGVLILSLNFRGYVDPDHTSIYIKSVTQYSEPGRMFDKNSNMATVSSVMHSMVMLVINIYYSQISTWLTEREMHATKQDFNSSLVAKRFFFETFNTFTDIAYLGFVQMDIILLKQELLSYYMTDEVRRLVTESLIPYFQKKQFKRSLDHRHLERTMTEEDREVVNNIKIELQLPKYEQFDDYLEIVINFGYITLFASAFPIAPLLTLAFHWMEMESDKWKIKNVYQRPVPYKQSGIGSWLNVLNIMSFVSILTNIFLFAFASRKITEFFPSLFADEMMDDMGSNVSPTAKMGSGRWVIAIVFIIENLMFFIILCLRNYVKYNKNIDWVHVYCKRQQKKKKINWELKSQGSRLGEKITSIVDDFNKSQQSGLMESTIITDSINLNSEVNQNKN